MTATKNRLELLGTGLYSPPEAARLVGISAPRVRRWIRGYEYTYPTSTGPRRGASPPVISGGVPVIGRYRAVSFLELVEILVVHGLLQRGVSMRTVRRAHGRAVQKLRKRYPFASEKLRTDGKGVFMALAQESDEYRPLLEMSSGQYVLPKILDRYLHQIDFDLDTLVAKRWWPLGKAKPIVVDPSIAFGSPVIAGTRVPVQSVLDALRAGETRKSVCRWLDLRPSDVSAVALFDRQGKAA